MARVLAIGDVHAPATKVGYLEFCKSIEKKYRTTKTVFIGDIVDHHAISFHQRHPDAQGALDEYHEAFEHVQRWRKAFPRATVCIGNHDERIQRLAADRGIPRCYLLPYSEVYSTPKWDWVHAKSIDGVFYTHGTGLGGKYPAFNAALKRATSVVLGHVHSVANICWTAGPDRRFFGMDVGCGVDVNHTYMQYGKNMLCKPFISCGVVLDGFPYLEPMDLG